jgi:hypothetical protein
VFILIDLTVIFYLKGSGLLLAKLVSEKTWLVRPVAYDCLDGSVCWQVHEDWEELFTAAKPALLYIPALDPIDHEYEYDEEDRPYSGEYPPKDKANGWTAFIPPAKRIEDDSGDLLQAQFRKSDTAYKNNWSSCYPEWGAVNVGFEIGT